MINKIPELKWLELNERNIISILKQCQPTQHTLKTIEVSFYSKDSTRKAPFVKFDMAELYSYSELIRYWVGQIKAVHQCKSKIIPSDGLFNYKSQKWSDDYTPLYALYYLSTGSRVLPRFIDNEKYAETKDLPIYYAAGLKPTYPPSDPNFKLEDARRALKCLGVTLPDNLS